MTLEHLKSATRQAIAVKVILKSGTELKLQNFNPTGVYTFNSESYSYSPLEYSGSARTLELDNSSATIYLPNFPLIANQVWTNDGLRKAIVIVNIFFPDNQNATPIRDMLVVKSSKFTSAYVEVQLQSPFSAVGAYFPSIYFRTGTGGGRVDIIGLIPEVPRSSQVNAV